MENAPLRKYEYSTQKSVTSCRADLIAYFQGMNRSPNSGSRFFGKFISEHNFEICSKIDQHFSLNPKNITPYIIGELQPHSEIGCIVKLTQISSLRLSFSNFLLGAMIVVAIGFGLMNLGTPIILILAILAALFSAFILVVFSRITDENLLSELMEKIELDEIQ